jgi:dTDP-4-dehydrorhamnose reductase
MKILITGASGYLGQHLLSAFIKRTTTTSKDSVEIHATYGSMEGFEDAVISSIGNKQSISLKIDKVDLQDKEKIHSYVQSNGPFDICYHTAAMASPKDCQLNVEKAQAINIPQYLFDALKDTPVVALSTDQVYCGTKAPYSEDSETGPLNVYAQSKLIWNLFC